MPKEYKECVKGYVNKGKPLKDAQRICAVSYYKRHGKTPKQAEGSITFTDYERALFDLLPLIHGALAGKSSNKDKTGQKEAKI